jgi:2-keto-4-pentenoate hydratase/2-oxohepta-3-ene-1,7-dioic acid hydratase in catechol pathway
VRWATFRSEVEATQDRVGLVENETIYAFEPGVRLIDLLGDGGKRLATAAEKVRRNPHDVFSLGGVMLRPPIPNPPSIRDFSSFYEHISTSMRNIGGAFNDHWFEAPVFYFTSSNNLVGDGEVVRVPGDTAEMDYELEVCAVIGLGGIDIDVADAERHIAGYSIFNDWSARDLQASEMRRLPIGPGKGKDAASGLGPFLVTPDEIEDRRKDNGFDLEMTARVNGREYSRGNWSSIYWSFAEMISFASRSSPLVPGDVIAAGTVGTGCILELSGSHGSSAFPWLKEGDQVELEVERIGRLTNTVSWGSKSKPLR